VRFSAPASVAFDEWYDTEIQKPIYSIRQMPLKKSKMISDRNSQDIYSDPGSFELSKFV
jgi:hypothetical protein